MKAIYFIRPIGQMFNFKGTTSRAEYFTYTVTSFLLTTILLLAAIVAYVFVGSANWYVVLPPELLNERGQIDVPDYRTFNLWLTALWLASQFPMVALTVRRLRDQYAPRTAWAWMLFPFVGPVVLFGHGFAPTFQDYPVTLPDGSVIMRSQQLNANRRRMAIVGIAAGASMVQAMQPPDIDLSTPAPRGGKKRATGRKSKSMINNRTNILGGRRAHMRNGSPVKASRNKYTWTLRK